MSSRTTHHASIVFWLLVATLLIAAWLRLWQIGTLPPGLHYDEAADTIIAQQIARGESAPIFVAAYTGKEVLFFYWAALWMKLIGPSVFAMRLAAAMLGVLTVAITYRVVCELFAPCTLHPVRKRQPHWDASQDAGSKIVALLAMMFIATSFWHVLMSRLGFRSIAEPFVQALALAVLFRGLRLNRWGWIIAAGALIGLNFYTYLAARLFPVAIAAIFFFFIAFDRGQRKQHVVQFVVVALTALIVFAPLGVYFLNNPDAFLTRIQQVAPRSDQLAALLDNVARSLGMFFFSGDPYIRFNLPGRPLFSLVWGVLFVIGLIVALVGVFCGRTVWRRTAYFSLISTMLIMLLPTALAVNEITPSNLRAIGLMPLVFVFPALGTWWLAKNIWTRTLRADERRLILSRQRRYASLIATGVLLLGAAETIGTYFRVYVNEPDLYVQSDGDLADIAQWLNTHDMQGEPVHIAALHYRHPTVAALSEKFDEVKWIAGDRGIVLPNGPGYLFFARLGLPDEAWLQKVLPNTALLDAPLAPDGTTNYRIYHLATQPVITPQVTMNANFGNIVELVGYDIEHPSTTPLRGSAQDASVTLYWRVLNKPDRGDYSTFAQLRDAHGFEWGKGGSFDYPSEQWTPGEIIVNRIDVPISAGAPPGDYELRVGVFSPETQQRINIVAPDGGFGGTVARLSPIPIDQITTDGSQLDIGTRLDWSVRPGLKLLGYTQPTREAQTGTPIDVTLYWQSDTSLNDLPVTLQLASCGCANQPVTKTVLTTTVPAQGTYPFNLWQSGEVVADRYRLRVPFDLASGDYTLEVLVGESEPIVLGAVNVWRGDRVMDEPPIAHPLHVTLGDAIELAGYNLDRTDDAIKLTLIWKSLKTSDEDYTVFTHVLDRSGQQIAGKDNQPVNGAYPTSHWMPGEYVIDEYVIPVAQEDAALEVGLYDPETGARLGETIRLK